MTQPQLQPVLVVDDTPAVARIVRMLLSSRGVTDIDLASSGPEAVRRLGQKKYALVLCKRAMKPLNALDLRQLMCRKESLATIPFIILSPDADDDPERLRAFERTHTLRVPFDADTLLATIEKAVQPAAA